MLDLAVTLLKRMSELEPDPNKRAWYRLFRHMDDDGSGRITFSELVDMVRSELRITLDEMSSSLLKSVWAALDVDSSGFITAGEFGVFMRKGEAHLRASQPQSTWKQRLASSRRLEAEAVTLALTKEKRAMVGVEAAEPAQVPLDLLPSSVSPQSPPAALHDQVLELSERLNRQVARIEPVPSKQCWYRVFKIMDDDGSGKITYSELLDLIRNSLEISTSEMSDADLKSVWVALDKDGSGFLTAGEFGAFMRKGEATLRRLRPQTTWKERRTAKNRLEAAAVTAALNKEKDSMAGVRAADGEACKMVASQAHIARFEPQNPRESASTDAATHVRVQMHSKLRYLFPQNPAWYKLFRHMDSDGSGKVTYRELVELVRNEPDGLGIPVEKLSDDSLRSVWAALDADRSGYITAGEFGKFMRQGEPDQPIVPVLERRRIASARVRADFETTTVKLTQQQVADSRKSARQYEDEVAQLSRELAAMNRPTSPRAPPVRASSARARPISQSSPRSALPAYLPSSPPGARGGPKRPPPPWLKEGRRDVQAQLQPIKPGRALFQDAQKR